MLWRSPAANMFVPWIPGTPYRTQGEAEYRKSSFSCQIKAELRPQLSHGFGGIFLSLYWKTTGYKYPIKPEDAAKPTLGINKKRTPKAPSFGPCTHPKEVPHSYREADGEGRGAQVVLTPLVCGSKDAQDQLEGEEQLHRHRLPRRGLVVQLEREEKQVPGLSSLSGWEIRSTNPKSPKEMGDFWHQ